MNAAVIGWLIVIFLMSVPVRLYIAHVRRRARRSVAPTYVVVRDGNIVAQPGRHPSVVAMPPVVASQLPGYMHWGSK